MSKRLIIFGVLIVAVAAAGNLSWMFYFRNYPDGGALLAVTAFAVGMTAFFGIMTVSDSLGGRWSLTKGGMRTAIAVSIVVTYLYFVTFYTFVGYTGEPPAITKSFLDSFTTTVTVTIGFYFGGEIVAQALGRGESSQRESDAGEEIDKQNT